MSEILAKEKPKQIAQRRRAANTSRSSARSQTPRHREPAKEHTEFRPDELPRQPSSVKYLKVISMLFALTYVLALLIQLLPESVFRGDVLWFARAQHILSSVVGIVFFLNLGFLARKHSN